MGTTSYFILHKMSSELRGEDAYYFLRAESDKISLNECIGKEIRIDYAGQIFCIQCGRKTAKSFQQGYCFPCFRRLQECNMCLIHPERCLIEEKGCPEHDWAHQQCAQSHIIYLANSSHLKVGITRVENIPTRWIDQGASQALPIIKTSNRYQAGLVEVAFKKFVSDRTDWRSMLKNTPPMLDLVSEKERLLGSAKQELQTIFDRYKNNIELLTTNSVTIRYPSLHPQTVLKSFSLDTNPSVEGRLCGIKGQYLLFDNGVMNLRKFGGYEIAFSVS